MKINHSFSNQFSLKNVLLFVIANSTSILHACLNVITMWNVATYKWKLHNGEIEIVEPVLLDTSSINLHMEYIYLS
jgi:hypothetical protein